MTSQRRCNIVQIDVASARTHKAISLAATTAKSYMINEGAEQRMTHRSTARPWSRPVDRAMGDLEWQLREENSRWLED